MLPLVNREIPLIADEWARPELGSGCVKITPAHDPNDYDVWQRHQEIGAINILNPDGTLNENAGPYRDLRIQAARRRVVEDLDKLGRVAQIEDREIELAHSDRSKTPIEPYLTDQWFVKMDRLAQSAMDAVTSDRVQIFPPRYAKGYLDWLGEKRDWPVSRQLWWGHRIPIWYTNTASEDDLRRAFASRKDVSWQRDAEQEQWLICSQEQDLAADAIPGHTLRQDPDVLDTWFSSALWPHSTLGWPKQTRELGYYYPTSVLITSRDIITLWVARMVLTGLHNVGDVPFRHVYIHPKILDKYGETMSKSKGNGVDPLDVIQKFGADSLRFALAHLTTETQDVRMPVEYECPHCHKLTDQTQQNRTLPRLRCSHCQQEFSTQWAKKPEDLALARGAVTSEKFELARNFCNKLWNASRFAMLNLEGYLPRPVKADELAVEDRWLLSRLATVTQGVTDSLENYHYADAARQLYDFSWDEFCSFYVEMVKARLADTHQRAVAQRVLAHALDVLLRLLHPLIPFITEDVWQRLGQLTGERGLAQPQVPAESIMVAAWPAADAQWQDAEIEARFARFQDVLRGVREIRSRQNIPPKTKIDFFVRCDAATAELLRPMEIYFVSMAGATSRGLGPDVQLPAASASYTLPGIEIFVDLAGLIDVEAEIAKNTKELEKLAGLIAAKQKKLSNEGFVSRAPAEVIEKERASLVELEQRQRSIEVFLAELRKQ
jgi:valyl-tRNA synthetase